VANTRSGSAAGATFVVTADHCPQILLRILGLFAQQDLAVDQVAASASRRSLRATVFVSDLDERRVAIIAEKMRQLVMVRTVQVRHNRT
jgi:acetolactate synthase regulatory subunit